MANLDPLLNTVPSEINHIHIMGICGTGMAALAGMLQNEGFTITGSDQNVYPPMSDFLADLGIAVKSGYSKNNLEPRPDLVIVGNVITRINEEAVQLAELAIPYLSFPQALAKFFIDSRQSLVVTGTHGKTTTCSILASALHHAQLDPTFMIGGIVPQFGGNFRIGEGKYFVAEGDEYDTAFFDKESKFLHYQPRIAVITSIEFDHADIFDDLESIKNSFKKFVKLIPEDGILIANYDDENVREVVSEARCTIQSYGLDNSYTWSLSDIRRENGLTCFTAFQHGEHYADFAIQLPGKHNCLNSLAVAAILHNIGLSSEVIQEGLKTFSGVRRRQEIRGIENGITVIDDFAHHPTAVRETLSALRMAYPDNRLVVVFEPRTNTSRRAIFQKDYITAFDCSDVLCIREPVPLTNVAADNHFSSARLAEDICTLRGRKAMAFPDTDAILSYLDTHLTSGDVVAILSNGGFDNIHNRLIAMLRSK